MGSKITREIRLQAIRKWLEGKTRDQIAGELEIGAGTVSEIIKEYRRGDLDADLLREVALNLKNSGLDIQSFAPLVGLREVLEQKEWLQGVRPGQQQQEEENDDDNNIDRLLEKKMESLIVTIEVFCFKHNLPLRQFFDLVYNLYLAAEEFDIPLESFPSHIEELKARIENLLEQIRYFESEKQIALKRSQTTERLLEEFNRSRPMFDENQKLKQKLEQVEKERDKYKMELDHERIWKRKEEEYEWSIPMPELDKANKDLGSRTGPYSEQMLLNPKYLKERLMDVYHHPSKYVEVIGKLMGQHNVNTKRKDG
jgi:transcriptional regulator with XRE-family HTH domain